MYGSFIRVSMPVSPGAFAHPVDARGTGFLLDARERLGKVLAGQELLPQARLGGVRRTSPAPDFCAATDAFLVPSLSLLAQEPWRRAVERRAEAVSSAPRL